MLARAVLVVFLISIGVFNTRDTAWPAVSWPMFSGRTTEYPDRDYSADVIRVSDSHGNGLWVRAGDLWGLDRYAVAKQLIAGSIDETSPRAAKNRRALMACVRMKYPDLEVRRIEIWRLGWEVDLDRVRTLDLEHPGSALLLVEFGEEEPGDDASAGAGP